MLGIFFMILGAVLGVLCLVSAFRNLFHEYKLNGNIKDVLVIGLIVTGLVTAYLISSEGLELKQFSNAGNHHSNIMHSAYLKRGVIFAIIGYAAYAFHFFVLDSIKKEKKKFQKQNSSHLWNLK